MFDVEKSNYLDDDDEEYKGIKDLEHLFEEINENDNDYYKPILVKSSFNESYKEYESRGDKDKTLTIEQYLNKIIPYLKELINNHKNIKNGSNEWKTIKYFYKICFFRGYKGYSYFLYME